MPVRSDVLIHDSRLYVATVAQTIATVDSGERWLVREINVQNDALVGASITIQHRRAGVSNKVLIATIATVAHLLSNGRFLVMDEGDQVSVVNSVAGVARISMYGARFVL